VANVAPTGSIGIFLGIELCLSSGWFPHPDECCRYESAEGLVREGVHGSSSDLTSTSLLPAVSGVSSGSALSMFGEAFF
jgi:hypothetical protein